MYKVPVRVINAFISENESDTKEIARWFSESLIVGKKRCVVFLKGDLGSGKTTFVRFVLGFLGIDENEFNGSPTFTIVNEYRNNIYHIDLYRGGDYEFLSDYFQGDGIFFIEWPESLSVKADVVVEFEIISDNRRKINVYTG